VVAFEMAQQLAQAGDEVPMLSVIDTYAPALHAKAIETDTRFYTPLKNMIFRWIVQRSLRNDGTVPTRFRNFHIIDTYDRAVLAYNPKPWKGALTVLKAKDSWGPQSMGWESLVKGRLDVQVLPGDHYNIIKEPHVQELARALDVAATSFDSDSSASSKQLG